MSYYSNEVSGCLAQDCQKASPTNEAEGEERAEVGGPTCFLSHLNGMHSSGLLEGEEGLQGQQASMGLWGAPGSEHSLRVAGSMVLLLRPVKGSDV